MVYKLILKPTRSYGIQLWGTASLLNIEIIQRLQNKILWSIEDAPWYISNALLHYDLQISSIREEIQYARAKYLKRFESP